jgi:endoplasmic reticulum Man9GlcNAc2 1,2-alpha-mannosidase
MGNDEYHPLSKHGSNLTESGSIGYTVLDVIDTMQIMGLQEEYSRAREWISTNLSFDRDGNFNTFEVRT